MWRDPLQCNCKHMDRNMNASLFWFSTRKTGPYAWINTLAVLHEETFFLLLISFFSFILHPDHSSPPSPLPFCPPLPPLYPSIHFSSVSFHKGTDLSRASTMAHQVGAGPSSPIPCIKDGQGNLFPNIIVFF